MTTFLLIRHAHHRLGGGTLAGRLPNITLSPNGEQQAVELGERLSVLPIDRIFHSPLERTTQTAEAIAQHHSCPAEVEERLLELDFGEWQGSKIAELKPNTHWQRFNSFRSGTRAPQGELMLETQLRIVGCMVDLSGQYPDAMIALVSHGDVIRAAISYFLGTPLDLFQRVEISPASVSVVGVAEFGPTILSINHVGGTPLTKLG